LTALPQIGVGGHRAKAYANSQAALQHLTNARPLTDHMLKSLLLKADEGSAAALLAAWQAERITTDQLRAALADAWGRTGRPDEALTRTEWRHMFRAAGYGSNGAPATPQHMTLYRGSTASGRRNWSWTDDARVAHAYVLERGMGGHIWTTDAPAHALLAHITHTSDDGVTYNEYVIDTDGLDIRLWR
jgi:hypothetical protein